MSSQIDGLFRTFTFASAISAFRFVQPDTTAGQAVVAVTGATKAIGVVQQDVAAGDAGTVKLFHPTFFGTVSGTAAAGLISCCKFFSVMWLSLIPLAK